MDGATAGLGASNLASWYDRVPPVLQALRIALRAASDELIRRVANALIRGQHVKLVNRRDLNGRVAGWVLVEC